MLSIRSRCVLALVAGAACAASGLAQSGSNTAQPAGQPAGATPPAAAAPAQPPAPTPIPVPDGPVVKKQELEGGLIVEDIKLGEGYEIKPNSAIVVHYHGTLKSDGKVFDSSFNRGEPAAYPLSIFIQGWQKGIPGMKVGGIRRLTIPAALAYGERGAGQDIPPNADLLFTIQIVDALQVEDVKVGEGEAATSAAVLVTKHRIVDGDGKEVQKSDETRPYIWVPREFQPVDWGCFEGMKPGGKRKITIPKQMNVWNPQLGHAEQLGNGRLTMEVELMFVRNFGPPPQAQQPQR
jgi:FKBP-type peptidyl-prolyl cis-trans isomerase